MKYLFSTVLFLFVVTQDTLAQDYPVRIDVEKGKTSIRFYAINDLSVTQEVKLELIDIKGLKGYSKPITKSVPAGSRRLMTSVVIGGAYSYRSSYTYIPKPSQAERFAIKKRKEEKLLKENENIMKGIVVFEKNNCSRCNMSTSYLLDNNIDFKIIDVSDGDGKGNRLMWDLIKKDGFKEGKILTPVFLVNGELSHTHKDLKGFLEDLVSK